jgi:hypothetical protein
MTDKTIARDENRGEVQRLKRDAVGIMGVMFMAVATAAPITAMVGNVPIAVGFGNGSHAPAGYIFATVVLSLFAIGYAAMAKHLTATDAFYGYMWDGPTSTACMVHGSRWRPAWFTSMQPKSSLVNAPGPARLARRHLSRVTPTTICLIKRPSRIRKQRCPSDGARCNGSHGREHGSFLRRAFGA